MGIDENCPHSWAALSLAYFKVCCFLFYQRLDFSKSRLPLGNFIGGDSVGRFLIKWKFDFFHEVKNTNCTQNIACFQSFGPHSVIK